MNQPHHNNQPDQKFLNKIAFLDSRQRENLILPEELIGQMPIQGQHTLLDVGSGSGFFTIPMAESTTGKVYAMDPDRRMLSVIQEKAKAKGLTNIELLQEDIEQTKIQNSSIDFVMASLILHEVSSLAKALTGIFEVLKPQGHLLCLEYEKDDSITEGPPMSIRISSEELEKALSAAGFAMKKKTKINSAVYTVLAVKKIS